MVTERIWDASSEQDGTQRSSTPDDVCDDCIAPLYAFCWLMRCSQLRTPITGTLERCDYLDLLVVGLQRLEGQRRLGHVDGAQSLIVFDRDVNAPTYFGRMMFSCRNGRVMVSIEDELVWRNVRAGQPFRARLGVQRLFVEASVSFPGPASRSLQMVHSHYLAVRSAPSYLFSPLRQSRMGHLFRSSITMV